MFTLLFNREQVEAYRLELTDEFGEYEHLAGGDLDYKGAVPPGCKKPVHLFYHLDLSDPRVGVQFPGLDALPIFYALGNCGGPFCYRVLPGHRIELLCQPYPKEYRAQILEDYPEPFGPCGLDLAPVHYDPRDETDVFYMGGVLGIDKLTKRQRAKLRKDFLRLYRDQIGVDLIREDFKGDDTVTIEEIVAGYTPFTQGMPDETCPNPDCEAHHAGNPLPVLLYLKPGEEDSFYRTVAGPDDGQLIWQLCRKCASIVVTNPCT